jgi:hypothetical protein
MGEYAREAAMAHQPGSSPMLRRPHAFDIPGKCRPTRDTYRASVANTPFQKIPMH